MSKSVLKHVPMNFLTNMIVFGLNIIINLYMTPFYITHLGIDGLGVVRMALLLPIYIGLATIIISGAVGRFLTLSLHEKNVNAANEFFNTSLFGISAIMLATVPLMVYISLNITNFLNIPLIYSEQASSFFLGIFIASEITVFSTLFLIPAYANNRLDIQNYIKIATLFLQTSAILILFTLLSSNIIYIGYSYISASFVGLLLSILVWKEFAPFLHIHRTFFKINKLKEITSMGSWLLINQLGSILFLSIDLLVINYFFGPEATGDYSVVLQWSILIRSMAGVIASIFGPIIVISYAKKNFDEIVSYSKSAVKFMGILIAIPIGLLMGFSEALFSLWLGFEFVKLVPLLWLMLSHLVINLTVLPLFSINTAYNKVKVPALVSLGFGAINLLLAILLSIFSDLGIYGVALAGAIVLTAKNAVFTPIYAAYILNISWSTFIKEIKFGVITVGISTFFSYLLSFFIDIDHWIELLLYGSFIVIVTGTIIWNGLLSKKEQELIRVKLKKKDI